MGRQVVSRSPPAGYGAAGCCYSMAAAAAAMMGAAARRLHHAAAAAAGQPPRLKKLALHPPKSVSCSALPSPQQRSPPPQIPPALLPESFTPARSVLFVGALVVAVLFGVANFS